MDGKREHNYDLLRIVCAIAVIMIHVSATYKIATTDSSFFGECYNEHIISILFYNTLPRFAVPCFVMLSGAFLLADDRNAEYLYFYKKTMKNIGIPTIVFSLGYFFCSEIIICIKDLISGEEISGIMSPIKAFVKGAPYYHMWYLYTLVGIYLLVPIILRFKSSIKENTFFKVSIILIVVASISGWTSAFIINWSIAKSVCYIGYFLMGYHMRKRCLNNKNNKSGVVLIVLGIFVEFILGYTRYWYSINGLLENEEIYNLVGNFNPLVVVASLLIFGGVSKLNINWRLGNVASQTFNIYLIHAGAWSLLSKVVKIIGVQGDARIIIPVSIVIVFTVSYILSSIYTNIWNKVERKYSLSEKICKMLG